MRIDQPPGAESRPEDGEAAASNTGRKGAIRRRALVLHPVLLAAYPVIYLWAHNLQNEIQVRDVLVPLAIVVGAATLLTVAGTLLFHNGPKAGVIVSLAIALFFSYGYLFRAVEGRRIAGVTVGTHAFLISFWILLGVSGVVATVRARGRLPGLTTVLNVAAVGLVAINLVTVGASELKPTPSGQELLGAGDPRIPQTVSPLPGRPSRPDVYYIMLEEYAGERTLLDQFGYDNRPFLDALTQLGFYVARDSSTNYPRTELSLASSLNMNYLDALTRRYGKNSGTFVPLFGLLRDHELARVMKSLRYRYIHVGSWWGPTAGNPIANVNVKYGGPSEFTSAFYQTTALAPVATDDFRLREWKRVQFQFNALEHLDRFKGPRFVFAHILAPHDPLVFDRRGRYVSQARAVSEPKAQAYLDELTYINQQVVRLVTDLLSVPPAQRPVIVIQSDEGPYEGHPTVWGVTPAACTLQQKFDIVNAFYLPGATPEQAGLYPSITPVNSFRVVLNLYFGADLALLPDRNFVFRDLKHIYDLRDVTEQVLAGIRTPLACPTPSP